MHSNHGRWKRPAEIVLVPSFSTHDRIVDLWVGPRKYGTVRFTIPHRAMLRLGSVELARSYYMEKLAAFLWDVHRTQGLARHKKGDKRIIIWEA